MKRLSPKGICAAPAAAPAADGEPIGSTPAGEPIAFQTDMAGFGRFWLRRLRVPSDMPLVHRWVGAERARFWGLLGKSLEEVTRAYVEIIRGADVYIGYHGDRAVFLLECYAPGDAPVGRHYSVEPGDRGMHVLLAPYDEPIRGFSFAVFTVVMQFLFSDPTVRRVVVEPDIRNRKIHLLNRRAGFRYRKVVELPGKIAHLAFCSREQHRAAVHREPFAGGGERTTCELRPIAHLEPETWAAVNAALVRKAISELAHERLLLPELATQHDGSASYVLATDDPHIRYTFRARVLELDHWDIDGSSLEKTSLGERIPLDASEFFLEFAARLGIDAATLPVYLEEVANTVYGAAYRRAQQELTAADLVHAEFQEIEGAMTEGHPSFLANAGRVGYDVEDCLAYAPEAGAPIRLVWVAAHKRNAEFNCVDGLSYETLLEEELGAETVQRFSAELTGQGLDREAYLFMPVHPWQWINKLALTFAPDIAARDLVCLGLGDDRYRAQQSVRTLFNADHPHKRYVKTALSVLNMGFMRGLSAEYMRVTPAINQWVDELIAADPYLTEKGFAILREVAAVGYRNRRFETALPTGSAYRKMLAALWRESPVPKLAAGQRLMTMAALLHRDRDGAALLPQLIASSGVDTDTWLDRYLDAYLAPLVHCFYRYDLAFMPHGENLILVLEDNVPVRALLKDVAEEAVIMDPGRVLPAEVLRLRVTVPENVKVLSIFTDVFDGIFRYLAQILMEQGGYQQDRFWGRVAACLSRYERTHPALAEKLARYDLFAPEFLHSCLNRLQLTNHQQMIDLLDPAKNLRFAGVLRNPVAAWRRSEHATPVSRGVVRK